MTEPLFLPIKWYRQRYREAGYAEWLWGDFMPQFLAMGKRYEAVRFHSADNIAKRLETLQGDEGDEGNGGDGGGGGVLAGVPLAHKEIIRRRGCPDEAGSAARRGMQANETASVLHRLDSAGALDCGQLTTVECALGITGHNAYAGTPPNPWNADYISGGSSSGSAAMVANGCLPAALGSDTGGSIRIPAAACGLVGFKPGFGSVSRSGVFSLSPSFDTIGPLTRSVEDAALMFEVIKAFDPTDSGSIDKASAECRKPARELRLSLARKFFLENCDADIVAVIEDLLGELKKHNHLAETDMQDCPAADSATMLIIAYEAARQHRQMLSADTLPLINPQTALRIAVGLMVEEEEYQRALAFRVEFTRATLQSMQEIDVLIAPALPYAVPTITATDSRAGKQAHNMIARLGRNMRIFNFLGFPALTLPIGRDKNAMPVAIQLIAKPFEEAKLFILAKAIEEKIDFWHKKPPLLKN